MSTIFRNIGWLLGNRGINALLSLVYLALATRSLGLAGFGQFAMIAVLAQALTGIASFNTWQAVVKWGHERGETARVTGFALALDGLSLSGGLVLAAIASWIAPFWLPLPASAGWPTFALCAASLVALRSTPTGILRLHERYDLASLAETSLPLARAAGAILAAIYMPTLAGFVAAWAAAELICAVTYWACASRFVALACADISLRRLPDVSQGVWSFVLATSFSRTAAVVSKQVLLLAVGAFGGAALAGGYRIASQLGQALVQLGEAVSRAIYPEFIKRAQTSAVIAQKMVLLSLAAGLFAAAIAIVAGKSAIDLIAGPQFVFAYPALAVLSFAGAMELAGASWDALLVSRHRAGAALLVRIVPLGMALAAIPCAIGPAGLVGVAICILAASAATLAGLSFAVLAMKCGPEAGSCPVA